MQLGLGVSFASIIAAASIPVALFYEQPRMTTIMLILALNFAITPLQALPHAWLTRGMKFDVLATIRVTAALTQAACTITFVWRGFGPVSLAWANLAATIAGIMLAVAIAAAVSSCLWLYAAKKHVRFTWPQLFKPLGKSAAVAGAAAGVPFAVSVILGWRSSDILVTLLVAVPGAAALFCAAAYATRHATWDEITRAIATLRA